MALIENVPKKHFAGQRNIVESTLTKPRALWAILNELIDCVNGISSEGTKIMTAFDFDDVAGGSVVVGNVVAGKVVSEVVLLIGIAFDNSTGITIGDAAAQARLMTLVENVPGNADSYKKDTDHEYAAATEVLVYFPTGTPTQGEGVAIIYLA